ncbi:hypothetical protein IFM89_023916 [Coptis chinensis]|uniref:CCHC-type domain-containing protein n=1 Tax=Coptis chinensis TaxID=261450 RepID=A0A835LX02_9MAGN|nr:hypothetical protein IFM89_023916 [Coptis chinensis]
MFTRSQPPLVAPAHHRTLTCSPSVAPSQHQTLTRLQPPSVAPPQHQTLTHSQPPSVAPPQHQTPTRSRPPSVAPPQHETLSHSQPLNSANISLNSSSWSNTPITFSNEEREVSSSLKSLVLDRPTVWEERLTGTVKWLDRQKGCGFITPAIGGEDLFVDKLSVQSEGYISLNQGEDVEFQIETCKHGRNKAVNVRVLDQGVGGGYTNRGSCARGTTRRDNNDGSFSGRGGVGGGEDNSCGGRVGSCECYNCVETGHSAQDCYYQGSGGGDGNWGASYNRETGMVSTGIRKGVTTILTAEIQNGIATMAMGNGLQPWWAHAILKGTLTMEFLVVVEGSKEVAVVAALTVERKDTLSENVRYSQSNKLKKGITGLLVALGPCCYLLRLNFRELGAGLWEVICRGKGNSVKCYFIELVAMARTKITSRQDNDQMKLKLVSNDELLKNKRKPPTASNRRKNKKVAMDFEKTHCDEVEAENSEICMDVKETENVDGGNSSHLAARDGSGDNNYGEGMEEDGEGIEEVVDGEGIEEDVDNDGENESDGDQSKEMEEVEANKKRKGKAQTKDLEANEG